VNVATKKGGLVTIANTRQYASQMPVQTIAIKKWAYDHRTDIENMIIALAEAGDQVRSFNLMVRMYPSLMPSFLPYEKAVDKSFLLSVISNHPELLEGKATETKYASEITSEVSSRSYHIEFETGSAVVRPESYRMLDSIFESAVVAEGLKLGIYGHTDNSGADAVNVPLSEKRAHAVKDYMLVKGLAANRIETKGYGSARPVADNGTVAGRSRNRRVEIVLGQ